jgi:hypothetical protein
MVAGNALSNTGFGMLPWILEASGTGGLFASVNWDQGMFDFLYFPLLWGIFPFWSWYLGYCGILRTHRILREKEIMVVSIVIVLAGGLPVPSSVL